MVGIEDNELTPDHLKEERIKFKVRLEDKIGNNNQLLYNGIQI